MPSPLALLPHVSVSVLALLPTLHAQAVTLLEGLPGDARSVRVIRTDGTAATLLPQVHLRAIALNGRTTNHVGELDRVRLLEADDRQWIERPDGARLFVYERTDVTGHGLLLVPTDGFARVVYEADHQLDVPIGVGTDGRHVVFAHGDEVTVVRLDGVFADTGLTHRSVTLAGGDALGASIVVGPTHAFFVADDDEVFRLGLHAGATPIRVTDGTGAEQAENLTLSGNGNVAAFLRSHWTDQFAVWVVGDTGPARRLDLPERQYLQPAYLPGQTGEPNLLLADDGSRLVVTEQQTERELFHCETGLGGIATQITPDAVFSDYIGVHILPRWSGDRLLFASGHEGWSDWYVRHADGTVENLTQTGSPEPPFLVGSLDVRARWALGNGTALATEGLGTLERLRHLDPAGSTHLLFDDLVTPPKAGSALTGTPDLRVVGLGGERLVGGQHGDVLLALPAGIDLCDPIRSANGVTALYAHVGGVVGVLALRLPDGTILLGAPSLGVPQLTWTAAGELVLAWPDRLQVLTVSGATDLPQPAGGARVLLSGARS